MNSTHILLPSCIATILLLVACSSEEATIPTDMTDQSESESTSADTTGETQATSDQMELASRRSAAATAIRVQAGFSAPGRPESDAEQHARRLPDQILAWAGIEDGMSVIDLGAAGGYYTENLAWAVGYDGWVIAQNTSGFLNYGSIRADLEARLADNRLPQVEPAEMDYSELPEEYDEMDAATVVQVMHDIYYDNGEEVALSMMKSVYETLIPGGFWILIDHLGESGNDNAELHRMEPAILISLLEQAGFIIVAESDLLAAPDDDPSISIFNPAVRGKTHRFVIKAMKPTT